MLALAAARCLRDDPFCPRRSRSALASGHLVMLQINDLTFDAWGRRFFDDATVSLPPGAKVGLVGRNGVGKSTLFKLILGELAAGGDEISLPKTARIGSVDQEHPATPVSAAGHHPGGRRRAPQPAGPAGDRRARADGRHLDPADRDRRRRRPRARRRNPGRPRLRPGEPAAADVGVLRRLADARGPGRRPVRRAGPAAARRTDQLSRPGRRAVAGGAAQKTSSGTRRGSRT